MWLHTITEPGEYNGLTIKGSPDPTNKETWEATAPNGLLITASDVVIRDLTLSHLHTGVEVRGSNVTIDGWTADMLSGDVMQGNGTGVKLLHGSASNLLEVLPYERYHPDIVQFRGGSNGLVDGIMVQPSAHPWARRDYQGCMFSDSAFHGWVVRNLKLPGVHPEHAVTFAEAHNCCVQSVWGGGAVRFRSLRGTPSTNCIAVDVDGPVEGITINEVTEQMFDVRKEFPNLPRITRGLENNNPGNIKRRPDIHWSGEATEDQFIGGQVGENIFEVFLRPEYGIRAMMIQLLLYQDGKSRAAGYKKLNSIRKIISTWSETDQDSYITYVARAVGVPPDQTISLRDYTTAHRMVSAMIEMENGLQQVGNIYPREIMDAALMSAGVPMPGEEATKPKPAGASTEIITGTAATGGGIAGGGIAVSKATDTSAADVGAVIGSMAWIDLIQLGCGIIVAVAAAVWLYDRYQTRAMGTR